MLLSSVEHPNELSFILTKFNIFDVFTFELEIQVNDDILY